MTATAKIYVNRAGFIFMALLLFACARENMPPDCAKPGNPTVNPDVTVKEGGSFQLHASGVKNAAEYIWSGPNNFYTDSANPFVNNVNVNNTGRYWVKARVGYCYSDSVATNVTVKTDSTCNLGDNVVNFPLGSLGAFGMTSTCTQAQNGNYEVVSTSTGGDSTVTINIRFKVKPVHGGAYSLTNSLKPADNQVYFQVISKQGGAYFANGNTCFVKVKNGHINIVICSCLFPGFAILSVNIACG
jgi:hypothetical protein